MYVDKYVEDVVTFLFDNRINYIELWKNLKNLF